MRFCQHCGSELDEGTRFCSNCGQGQQVPAPAARHPRSAGEKRLHCPECKSRDISPIVETEITGGTSLNHSFSKRNSVSAMQFNNTHRNYWMCSSCGCKFRNIQNLEQELKSTENLVKRGILGVIFMIVLTLFYMFVVDSGFFCILSIFLVILFVTAVFILKKRVIRLNEERVYLKRKCFD